LQSPSNARRGFGGGAPAFSPPPFDAPRPLLHNPRA
jgi:hypothetical protein